MLWIVSLPKIMGKYAKYLEKKEGNLVKRQEKFFRALVSLCAIGALAGCAVLEEESSADATPEDPIEFQLGHAMNETHTVHEAMMSWVEKVEERSEGRIQINVFPNAQLGDETEMLEQLQAGILDLVKVASPGMANYHDGYHVFGMPFLFEDEEHFYRAMNSPEMREFFMETEEDGFVSLTYYTSGQRSFYTDDVPIQSPEDLQGLNVRVQDMRSQTDMVSAMGGTPVAMAYGDVYTSLQTGMLDGTENNETALVDGFHGEVAKVYSYTEHAIIPDVFIMSEEAWNQLTEDDQELFIEAAIESTEEHHELWDAAIEESIQQAEEEMDVEFIEEVDRDAFREATEHIIEEYSEEYEEVERLVDMIQSID